MHEFKALRSKAREKRDRAIERAREEYAATLVRIASLEQDLLGKHHSTRQKISACIESVIPTDRTFTTVDIMSALEALDDRRVWRKRSVDNHLSRLRERGLVRRLRKSRNTEPALYVRVGVDVEQRPFEDMTLPEVVESVLVDGPKSPTEIVVAMLEAGYETTMAGMSLRNAVGRALRAGAFSKCWESHEAALALYFAHYNFCRDGTIKTTPAVKAKLADKPWTMRRLLEEVP